MNEYLTLWLAVVMGSVLGAIYFGGLWITLNRGLKSNGLGLWLSVSFMLRTAVVLYGFYWIGHAEWQRFAACLLGFMIMRIALARWLGPTQQIPSTHCSTSDCPTTQDPLRARQEPTHAP